MKTKEDTMKTTQDICGHESPFIDGVCALKPRHEGAHETRKMIDAEQRRRFELVWTPERRQAYRDAKMRKWQEERRARK
jgi:hypothetical protein